jgi:hypothetical protein
LILSSFSANAKANNLNLYKYANPLGLKFISPFQGFEHKRDNIFYNNSILSGLKKNAEGMALL